MQNQQVTIREDCNVEKVEHVLLITLLSIVLQRQIVISPGFEEEYTDVNVDGRWVFHRITLFNNTQSESLSLPNNSIGLSKNIIGNETDHLAIGIEIFYISKVR